MWLFQDEVSRTSFAAALSKFRGADSPVGKSTCTAQRWKCPSDKDLFEFMDSVSDRQRWNCLRIAWVWIDRVRDDCHVRKGIRWSKSVFGRGQGHGDQIGR